VSFVARHLSGEYRGDMPLVARSPPPATGVFQFWTQTWFLGQKMAKMGRFLPYFWAIFSQKWPENGRKSPKNGPKMPKMAGIVCFLGSRRGIV